MALWEDERVKQVESVFKKKTLVVDAKRDTHPFKPDTF